MTKEPWEMTFREINTELNRKNPVVYKALYPEMKYIGEIPSYGVPLSGRHRNLIKQALSEGKPVPESVLDDYPDL